MRSGLIISKRCVITQKGAVLIYEGNSISKLQIVIEKNQMEIMTYKQPFIFQHNLHTYLNTCPTVSQVPGNLRQKILLVAVGTTRAIVRNFCTQLWTAWRDRQCSPYMGSISLWISFASVFFAHKKRTMPRCSILIHVLRGAAIL